ncbi:hypothetical protein ETECTG_CDS0015 [Escherichia phage ETEC-TG]|nr:hypothetical protein ETECTG_CDS0015 [Escherichia phage ETEC-TG]
MQYCKNKVNCITSRRRNGPPPNKEKRKTP